MAKRIIAFILSLSMFITCLSSVAATTIVEPSTTYKQYRKYLDKVYDGLGSVEDDSDEFLSFFMMILAQDIIVEAYVKPLSQIKAKDLNSVKKLDLTPIIADATVTYSDSVLKAKITSSEDSSLSGNLYYYAKSGRYALDSKREGNFIALDIIKGPSTIYIQSLTLQSDGEYTGIRTMLKDGSLLSSLSTIKSEDIKSYRLTKAPENFAKFAYKNDMRLTYQNGVTKITVSGKSRTVK